MALPPGTAPDATVADVGEFALIDALTPVFEQGEHVLVGPGDDAAVLRVRTGHVVISTDLMVRAGTSGVTGSTPPTWVTGLRPRTSPTSTPWVAGPRR